MGDESLEQLLIEEIKIVFKYLIKIGASKEDAEDIVQETLYKTIKNIDSIEEDKITAWLFRVSMNSFYNLYSKNKRYSSTPIENLHEIITDSKSSEDVVITRERKQEVYEVLDKLNSSYKKLLILKYFMDLSYKDIAEMLEISEHQVKIYLYRARNKFKGIWEEARHE